MVLQTSGPISLSDIQGEWGGVNPISLGEYYAGGIYVPFGTIGPFAPVASTGPITIGSFYGTYPASVSFNDQSIFDSRAGTAYAEYELRTSNGRAYANKPSGSTLLEQWVFPDSQAAGFEVKATLLPFSAPLASGTLDTWELVDVNRAWRIQSLFSGDSRLAELTIELRRRYTTTVLDSITVSLEVTEF